jgi:uncharacterized lipoprotein YajG
LDVFRTLITPQLAALLLAGCGAATPSTAPAPSATVFSTPAN